MYECRDEIVRITGIDPGSYHLGAGTFDHNARHDDTRLVDVSGMDVDDHPRYPDFDVHGQRGKRLQLMGEFAYQYFCNWRPDYVVCEDAFLRRGLAKPYRSLVEGIMVLRQALFRYDPTMQLILVEPSTAKAAFGAAGKGVGKEGARAGVYKYVAPLTEIDLTALNEHQIDAVGIGFWGVEEWRQKLQLPTTPLGQPLATGEPMKPRRAPPVPKSRKRKRT